MSINSTFKDKYVLTLLFLVLSLSKDALCQSKRQINPIPPTLFAENSRVACQLFSNPANYETGLNLSFPAPVNNNSNFSVPSGANLGCMGSVPNQAWLVITINTPGNLYFNIFNSNNYDIDAVIWGPIANGDLTNTCSVTSSTPVTCDFDGGRPDLYLNNTQIGQKYLMLVTNYSNANTTININQPIGGSVNYSLLNLPNCSSLPTATLTGNTTTVNEGDPVPLSISFTGTSPWTYRLSDGTIGNANVSPHNISVYPTAESTTYTISSVSNTCGTSSGNGLVGVSTVRNVATKSCFPLDGNVIDSRSLNTGNLNNGAVGTTDRFGNANKAILFDGINDHALISTNQINNNTFTVGVWVKAETLPSEGNNEVIFTSIGATTDNHFLSIERVNNENLWKFGSNGINVYSHTIADNNWHHITGLRTGGNIKIYIDGVLENSTNTNSATTYQNNNQLFLGKGVNGKFFNGKIDELKIFQGSLIDPEITILKNATNCNNVYDETYISIQSINTEIICNGSILTLRALTNNLIIESGVQFLAEMSDINGSFANPTVIGNSTFLPVNITIPFNTPAGIYKIRLRYAGQLSLNELSIYVNNSGTYNLTGGTVINDGQSANLNIAFTGTGPWYYSMSEGLSGVATTSPWQITVSPDQNTNYYISGVTNVCGNLSSINNTTSVQVNFTKENISCFSFSGNVLDEKSNNTASLNGPVLTENRFGQVNKAYQFNGTDNFIDFTTNNLRKREFTFSAWVLLSSLPASDQAIISMGSYSNNTYQELSASNQGWKFTSYGNSGGVYCNTTNFFAANQWVHVTAVRNYQSLKIYVNGLLSVVGNNNSFIPFKNSDLGRIGGNSAAGGSFFNGKIDDVRLYKGALNDDEVFALYSRSDNCPVIENNAIIVTRGVSPSNVCAGSKIYVNYTSSNVNISPTYPILVQLSDQNGSFANPITIGSGITSPIEATIPNNTANGNFYRVRVLPTHPNPVLNINSQGVIINGTYPTATISGGGILTNGSSIDLSVAFTGSAPWTYSINNGPSTTTSNTPINITVSPSSTTIYTVTSISNSCGNGTAFGSAEVQVPPVITLISTSLNSLCGGNQANILFTSNFNPSNGFKVELSNKVGSFEQPLVLGTGNVSPIAITIPDTMSFATGYKIRISSFDNSVHSNTTQAFEIKRPLLGTISGSSIRYEGASGVAEIDFTGTPPFTYSLSNGFSGVTSSNHLEIPFNPGYSYSLTFNSLSNACGNGVGSGSANVEYIYNAIFQLNCYPLSGNSNDLKSSFHLANSNATFTTDRSNASLKAMYLNGNAFLSNTSFNSTSNEIEKTYSLWIRPTASYPTRTRLMTIDGETLYIKGNQTDGYKLQFAIGTPINLPAISPLETPEILMSDILINTWAHIAIIKSMDEVRLFVNGIAKYSEYLQTNQNENGIYIGGKSSDSNKFTGMIDDIQIFGGILDAAKINQLYLSGIACDNFLTLPEIKINTQSPILACIGSDFNLNYKVTNITLSNSQLLKFELSDSNGNFSNPILLKTSTSTSGTVILSLPANLVQSKNYKLRLRTDSYTPTTTHSIIIQSPVSAVLSGSATINEGELTTLAIQFTGSIPPVQYKINNGILQTSDSSSLQITVNPTSTTSYSLSYLSNGCGIGNNSGVANVTVVPKAIRQVSCFAFDNGSLADSRNANQATKNLNGPITTTDRYNQSNKAYYFDGLNDMMTITRNTALNSDFTITSWVNITGLRYAALPNEFMIYQIGQDLNSTLNQHLLYIYYEPDMGFGPEAFYLRFKANGLEISKHLPNFSLNQWNHFTVVRTNQNYKFFINGVLVHHEIGNLANLNFNANSNIYFGGAEDAVAADAKLKGKLDNVNFYKGALTNGQIIAQYSSNTDCFDATTYSCLSDKVFNTILNGLQTVQVSNSITGSSLISNGSNIHFDSKNSVMLLPGFKTESNVTFKATVDGGCQN